jgi:hypothetical protein
VDLLLEFKTTGATVRSPRNEPIRTRAIVDHASATSVACARQRHRRSDTRQPGPPGAGHGRSTGGVVRITDRHMAHGLPFVRPELENQTARVEHLAEPAQQLQIMGLEWCETGCR